MKKYIVFFGCICFMLLFQSCYCSTVCVGDMKKDEPAVCVNTIHNHKFIYGLVNSGKVTDGKIYVSDKKDYKFKHYRSFVDQVLSSITCGIYTPTTTKVYLPANARNE